MRIERDIKAVKLSGQISLLGLTAPIIVPRSEIALSESCLLLPLANSSGLSRCARTCSTMMDHEPESRGVARPQESERKNRSLAAVRCSRSRNRRVPLVTVTIMPTL